MMLLLLACAGLPDAVEMTGTVWDAPYGAGAVVPGATVEVLDGAGEAFASATAASDGSFAVDVPAGVPFFANVSAEGHRGTAFSGTAGLSDFAAPEGFPWTAPESWVEALRAQFAACPSVAEEGVIVAGEIVADAGGYPVLPSGSARAYGAGDVEIGACYLDADGVSSTDAAEVGDAGLFAIFGAPAGELVVDVRYDSETGEDPVELYRFVAPEGGVVPLFPAILPVL